MPNKFKPALELAPVKAAARAEFERAIKQKVHIRDGEGRPFEMDPTSPRPRYRCGHTEELWQAYWLGYCKGRQDADNH